MTDSWYVNLLWNTSLPLYVAYSDHIVRIERGHLGALVSGANIASDNALDFMNNSVRGLSHNSQGRIIVFLGASPLPAYRCSLR